MAIRRELRRVLRQTDRLVREAGADEAKLAGAYQWLTERLVALYQRHRTQRSKDPRYMP
jgi:hypothetical protein